MSPPYQPTMNIKTRLPNHQFNVPSRTIQSRDTGVRRQVTSTMDPFSAIAGAVSLGDTTFKVAKAIYRYIRKARDAREDIRELAAQLTSLGEIFEELEESRDFLPAIRHPFEGCRRLIIEIASKLGSAGEKGGLYNALKWPFKSSQTRQYLQELRELASLISLALDGDTHQRTRRIEHAVEKQGASLERIEATGFASMVLNGNVAEGMRILRENDRNREIWRAVELELNIGGINSNHDIARDKREEGTGEWLIQSEKYIAWKSAVDRHSGVLWMHAKPGAGKTVICSTIVEDLRHSISQDPDDARLAFFYCRFDDKKDNTTAYMLRSFLRQILDQATTEEEFKILEQLLPSRNSATESSITRFANILSLLSAIGPPMYLVIDALDEFPEEHQEQFFQDFLEPMIAHTVRPRILITSRKNDLISESFSTISCSQQALDSESIDADICYYIERILSRDKALRKWSPELKSFITTELAEKADGMSVSQSSELTGPKKELMLLYQVPLREMSDRLSPALLRRKPDPLLPAPPPHRPRRDLRADPANHPLRMQSDGAHRPNVRRLHDRA